MAGKKPPTVTKDDLDAGHAVINETDRGCVLVLAAQVDDALERSLRSLFPVDEPKLIDGLFRGYGPLDTFSAKIALCRALGIITGELKSRLDALRRLRNDFAHSKGPLSLGSESCSDRVELIVGDADAQESLVRSYLRSTSQDKEADAAVADKEIHLNSAAGRRLALALSVTKMIGNVEGYDACAPPGRGQGEVHRRVNQVMD